LSSIF
jgi:hypothetical protein